MLFFSGRYSVDSVMLKSEECRRAFHTGYPGRTLAAVFWPNTCDDHCIKGSVVFCSGRSVLLVGPSSIVFDNYIVFEHKAHARLPKSSCLGESRFTFRKGEQGQDPPCTGLSAKHTSFLCHSLRFFIYTSSQVLFIFAFLAIGRAEPPGSKTPERHLSLHRR